MNEKGKSKDAEQTAEFSIAVRWGSLEGIPTVYANNIYVTHAGDEFYVVFGELEPPVVLGMDKSELPELIEIRPLVKLAIAPDVMTRFVDVLSDNIRKFKEKRQREREEK